MSKAWTIGLFITWILVIFIAPIFATHDPRQTDTSNILQPPKHTYLLGTDNLGRDVFSRTVHGGRQTIGIATSALLIAVVASLIIAITILLAPQSLQNIAKIVLNAWLAFPPLLMALIVLTSLGRGAIPIAIATGFSQLPYYVRFTISTLQQYQTQPYVLTAKSLGASRWHIMKNHILPNSRPNLVSYATVIFAYCIINSAALSLLGLGGDPSIPDWGIMLATGRDAFRYAPWVAIAPAVAITITIILTNQLADTIR